MFPPAQRQCRWVAQSGCVPAASERPSLARLELMSAMQVLRRQARPSSSVVRSSSFPSSLTASVQCNAASESADAHGIARIDQEPEFPPAFHVPVTTARNADSSICTSDVSGLSGVWAVHVPEYSPVRPAILARHAPSHAFKDLLADQPPCMRILPAAS